MTSRWGNGLSQTLVSRLEELERLRRRGQRGRERVQMGTGELRLLVQRRLWQGLQTLKLQAIGELGTVEMLIARTRCVHCGSRSLQPLTTLLPCSSALPPSLHLLLPSESRPKSPIAVSNPSTSELENLSAIPFESFHWDDRSSLLLEPAFVQGWEHLRGVLHSRLRPVLERLGIGLWQGGVRTESSSSLDEC